MPASFHPITLGLLLTTPPSICYRRTSSFTFPSVNRSQLYTMVPADLAPLIVQLEQNKTLGKVPREELAWLAAHGALLSLDSGQILSHKGIQVESLYILLVGRVVLFVD